MDQTDYFNIFKAGLDLKGKTVLEVGGAVHVDSIVASGVAEWTAVDVSDVRLEGAQSDKGSDIYKTVNGDIADYSEKNSFDFIYSTNCFEHINRLEPALVNIFDSLKDGGILFSLFSPIWTSPVGHHAYVVDDDGKVLIFDGNIVPPWFHLAHEEEEVRRYLSSEVSPKVAEDFCRMTYHGKNINRLIDREYESLIRQFPYKPILNLKIRTRKKPDPGILNLLRNKYPDVVDFRTMGYFWVLKKGTPTLGELARFYSMGMGSIIRRKFLR